MTTTDLPYDDALRLDQTPAAKKVREFPQKPGVYLMKDKADCVIYIGKAKNLRNRARSYFRKAAEEVKFVVSFFSH